MSIKAILALCLLCLTVHAQPLSKADIYFNRLADAIFKAENSPKWPYGIKANVKDPRAECIRICKDAWSDYCMIGCKGDWISYFDLVLLIQDYHSSL